MSGRRRRENWVVGSARRYSGLVRHIGRTADSPRGTARRYEWTLSLEPKAASASNKAARRPDIRVMDTADTARQILAGKLSPLDAFLGGNLRIRGDTELAKRLLKHAADGGETDICC